MNEAARRVLALNWHIFLILWLSHKRVCDYSRQNYEEICMKKKAGLERKIGLKIFGHFDSLFSRFFANFLCEKLQKSIKTKFEKKIVFEKILHFT